MKRMLLAMAIGIALAILLSFVIEMHLPAVITAIVLGNFIIEAIPWLIRNIRDGKKRTTMDFLKRALVLLLLAIATITVFITILVNSCVERLEKKDRRRKI